MSEGKSLHIQFCPACFDSTTFKLRLWQWRIGKLYHFLVPRKSNWCNLPPCFVRRTINLIFSCSDHALTSCLELSGRSPAGSVAVCQGSVTAANLLFMKGSLGWEMNHQWVTAAGITHNELTHCSLAVSNPQSAALHGKWNLLQVLRMNPKVSQPCEVQAQFQ